LLKTSKFLWPNIVRFCPNFRQIKTFGALHSQRLHHSVMSNHGKDMPLGAICQRTSLCNLYAIFTIRL